MASLALKYRPKCWNDIIGQEAVVSILQRQVATKAWKNTYLFAGAHGCGKAQPLYSKVLTPCGYTTMEDIEEGDIVVDGYGYPTKVVATFPQECPHPIYEIKLSDGTSFRVADNHLNSVVLNNIESVLTTEELIDAFYGKGNKIGIRAERLEFQEKKLPIDPYLLGILIGDGSLHNDFSVSLYESDIYERIEFLCNAMGYALSKKEKNPAKQDYRIVKENKRSRKENILKTAVRNLGLDVLSKNKFIPRIYMFSSVNQRLELMRGLMDTDGEVRPFSRKDGSFGSTYVYCTSSKQLSEDFTFLARSLGCVVTVARKEARIGDKVYSDCYRHYIQVPYGLRVVSSNKQRAKAYERCNDPIRKIVAIEYVGVEECKCIMVESKYHTYITDNVTLTHNTSTARILASEINDGEGSPIELDCASNNGVDTIRGLIADAQQSSIDSMYKTYILDEAHNLTKAAWDAALKLIEEPPSNSIFIFCTTNPDKIPSTILSRVQRFDFLRVSKDAIADRLEFILNEETHNKYERSALERIAVLSDGHMRDAIQYMDKCLDASESVDTQTIETVLGLVRYQSIMDLLLSLYKKDMKGCLDSFEQLKKHNTNLMQVYDMLTAIALDIAIYAQYSNASYINIPKEYIPSLPKDVILTRLVADRMVHFRKYLLPNNVETFIKTLFIEVCGGSV